MPFEHHPAIPRVRPPASEHVTSLASFVKTSDTVASARERTEKNAGRDLSGLVERKPREARVATRRSVTEEMEFDDTGIRQLSPGESVPRA